MTKHSKNNRNKKQKGGQINSHEGNSNFLSQSQSQSQSQSPSSDTETWYSKIMGSSPTSEKKQPGISNLFGMFGGKKSRRAKKTKRTNKSKTQRRQ
jgi:hypothetical protein